MMKNGIHIKTAMKRKRNLIKSNTKSRENQRQQQ
jgi:hypothetical protein